MKKIYLILLFVCFTASLFCANIYVDGENNTAPWLGTISDPYQTITQAVDNSSDGDIILVEDYDYIENVVIFDKSLILQSVNGSSNCSIIGDGISHVIQITGSFTNPKNVEVIGFTIENSGSEPYNNEYDSGIYVYSVNVKIDNNVFVDCCHAVYFTSNSAYRNSDCEITNNIMSSTSNANSLYFMIDLNYCKNAVVIDNIVTDNTSGVKLFRCIDGEISGNYISNNYHLDNLGNYYGIGININNTFLGDKRYIISENFILDNKNLGIYLYEVTAQIEGNKIEGHDVCLWVEDHMTSSNNLDNVDFNNNLVIHDQDLNGFEQPSTSCILIDYAKANFVGNTFVSDPSLSAGAINIRPIAGVEDNRLDKVYNNIFWDYSGVIFYSTYPTVYPVVDYCCYNGFLANEFIPTPNHNISSNPQFVSPQNGNFELSYIDDSSHSPCINAGSEDLDGDGLDYRLDIDDRDPDNSRLDIGYSPYHFTDRDFKYYNDGWHWDSFPRLNRDMTGEEDIVPILESMNPLDYSGLWMDYVSPDVLVFNSFLWNPTTYDVKSTNLYKVKLAPEDPRELVVFGNQLTSNHIIMGTMNANTWYWIGYWLTENQNIYDALYDYWDDVSAVFAEDWAYSKQQRGIGGSAPPVWSPEGKTMEYGKGYMIKFGQSITNFHWSDGGDPAKVVKKTTPENFTFTVLPDYEPIDILGINSREDVIEVGVFENETCVGAVVVEDFPVQLLAYTGQEECDSLSFRVLTSTRNQVDISNYCVFDKHTGNFQSQSIVPGSNEYSIVTLGEPTSDTIPTRISLESNYPNPFNPKTTISFTSFGNQKLTLTIYNLKGQRIKELFSKTFNDGEHTYVWDSKDDNGLPVSSGVYFYKLESKDFSCIKKMLLMK